MKPDPGFRFKALLAKRNASISLGGSPNLADDVFFIHCPGRRLWGIRDRFHSHAAGRAYDGSDLFERSGARQSDARLTVHLALIRQGCRAHRKHAIASMGRAAAGRIGCAPRQPSAGCRLALSATLVDRESVAGLFQRGQVIQRTLLVGRIALDRVDDDHSVQVVQRTRGPPDERPATGGVEFPNRSTSSSGRASSPSSSLPATGQAAGSLLGAIARIRPPNALWPNCRRHGS